MPEDQNPAQTISPKPSPLSLILSVVSILAVVGLGVYLVKSFNSQTIVLNDMSQKIGEVSDRLDELESTPIPIIASPTATTAVINDNTTTSTQATNHVANPTIITTTETPTTQQYLTISEWGIKYRIPNLLINPQYSIIQRNQYRQTAVITGQLVGEHINYDWQNITKFPSGLWAVERFSNLQVVAGMESETLEDIMRGNDYYRENTHLINGYYYNAAMSPNGGIGAFISENEGLYMANQVQTLIREMLSNPQQI